MNLITGYTFLPILISSGFNVHFTVYMIILLFFTVSNDINILLDVSIASNVFYSMNE